MSEFSLGIHCDYLLTMSGGSGKVLHDQFIGVNGSRIATIAPWGENNWKCDKLIKAKNKIVMPGLINGHTHLCMSLFRGLADDLPFHQWLHEYILPLEAKLVDAKFVRVGTQLAALECIQNGVTTVCDMYFFAQEVATVLDEAGLRGLVCEAITDFPTPDNKNLDDSHFKILQQMCDKYKNHERIQPCVGPHAPYTCSDDTIKKSKEFALKHQIPIVMHVSETQNEVNESLKKYSKTPVKRLFDLGLLTNKTIFAHCVCITDEDIDLLQKTGTSAIYNPESNMKLGSGVAPVPKMLKAGIKVGIGTDGAASNNDLSILSEMDVGAKLQKLSHLDNTALTGIDTLRMATIGGAEALGISKNVGSLEVGKFADIICLDLDSSHMRPLHDVVSQIVYTASAADVETVICHGSVLMENREIKTLDREKIFKEVDEYYQIIKASLK
ncbi:MAG: amidohydrolase [Oligoflexia bacterium]|nr:amidohydrolase [Oligoflexia bacterium]